MLRNPNPGRRLAGRLTIAGAIAIALPLTASRAVDYVEVAAAPAPPTPTIAAVQPVRAVRAVKAPSAIPAVKALAAAVSQAASVPAPTAIPPAPAVPTISRDGDDSMTITGDFVTIDGKTKRWDELTQAEKARVRLAVAKARTALENVHIDRDRIERNLAKARASIDKADFQPVIARTASALHEMDRHNAEIQAAISRALAAVDHAKIAANMGVADQAMRKAQAELDRIDARIRADDPR